MNALSKKNLRASHYSSDQARWRAVVRRDHGADGMFFYSVATTGIYCRPSCASRLARRENVRFHSSCDAAEKAGFRACKRCQPRNPVEEPHLAAITKACRLMKSADAAVSLANLARSVGMSRFHFHRVFTRITGVTPKAYAEAIRAELVRGELSRRKSVTEAVYGAGFNSNGRFYARSSEMLGMLPKNFRAGGIGATIRFAVGECSLGSILVASSKKGICAILLGDDASELVEDIQRRFSNAQLIGGDKKFERLVAQVIGFVEAPRVGLNLPLDVRGTAFQQRVWNALREIPAGSTTDYTEIAQQIGAPKAVRAVAGACAANAIAVAIPCHRVVRMDGNLSGYRWGVQRKRALLEKEKTST